MRQTSEAKRLLTSIETQFFFETVKTSNEHPGKENQKIQQLSAFFHMTHFELGRPHIVTLRLQLRKPIQQFTNIGAYLSKGQLIS